GAGAVVTSDLPDFALALGTPARVVGWMCECGVRLSLGVDARAEREACAKCGAAYERDGLQVRRVEGRR
ncbi:MAG: N-acetyltransferase, partial [Chloroflexota bacterium]